MDRRSGDRRCACAVTSVAFAAKSYKVHLARRQQAGKGSLKASRMPTGSSSASRSRTTDPNKRATVIEEYAIGAEGLVANPKSRPKCTFSDSTTSRAASPPKCKKARVGRRHREERGRPERRPRSQSSSPCNLKLTLYNIGDRHDPPSRRRTRRSRRLAIRSRTRIGCALPIHARRDQRQVREDEDRRASPPRELRFTVPTEPEAPVAGVDNSVRRLGTNLMQVRRSEERQEARLLLEGRLQGQQAHRACDVQDGGQPRARPTSRRSPRRRTASASRLPRRWICSTGRPSGRPVCVQFAERDRMLGRDPHLDRGGGEQDRDRDRDRDERRREQLVPVVAAARDHPGRERQEQREQLRARRAGGSARISLPGRRADLAGERRGARRR